MSCIKAVVNVSDEALVTSHRELCHWKKKNPMGKVKTNYSYAMRHYARSRPRTTNANVMNYDHLLQKLSSLRHMYKSNNKKLPVVHI